MKKVMPGLGIPSHSAKKMNLTGSASDLNNLVFGQIPSKRNENCFIFTLQTESTETHETSEIPNSNQEILYFMCLVIDDLSEYEGQE